MRQGDVFGLVDFPSAKAGIQRGFSPATAPTHAAIEVPNVAIMASSARYALVVSHDCDFNEGKRDFFLTASVHDLTPQDKKPERLAKLRLDNDADRHTSANQIALRGFLLEPLPGIFDEPKMAVFDTITPIAMKFRSDMLRLKRAEMSHEHRVMLRKKLGLFVAREENDIADELKIDAPADPSDLEWQEDLTVGS